MAARRIVPLTAFFAAFVWMIGLFFSAEAAAFLATASGDFWQGVVGLALGLLIVPVVVSTARDRTLQLAGLLIAVGMAVTGTMLLLDALGFLGQDASLWIVPAAGAPFIGLFAWIAATSYRGRRPRDLGSAVFALGLLNLAAVPIAIVGWWSPYTHTNATLLIDGLFALVILVSIPGWLIAVSIHLWRAGSSRSIEEQT